MWNLYQEGTGAPFQQFSYPVSLTGETHHYWNQQQGYWEVGHESTRALSFSNSVHSLRSLGLSPRDPDHSHIFPISLPVLEVPRRQMQTWGRPEGGSHLCLRTVLSYVCWRWHLFNTAGKLSTPILGFFQAQQLAQVLHLASPYILDTFPQALLPQALFQVQWFFKHCKTPVPWPLLGRRSSPFSVTSWKNSGCKSYCYQSHSITNVQGAS